MPMCPVSLWTSEHTNDSMHMHLIFAIVAQISTRASAAYCTKVYSLAQLVLLRKA